MILEDERGETWEWSPRSRRWFSAYASVTPEGLAALGSMRRVSIPGRS